MNEDPSAYATVKALLAAGMAGSLVRLLLCPRQGWRRWLVQILAGALAAVFLGGILALMLSKVVGNTWHVYAAAGFIVGSAAEKSIEAIQRRLLGDDGGEGG